jgi:hypothetical protein
MSDVVVMRGSGLPPREPDATCEGCGTQGTVARALRTDAGGRPTEVHRFCAACWPEQSARLRARWSEEDRVLADAWLRDPDSAPRPPSRGAAFESATWHATLAFVGMLMQDVHRGVGPSPTDLTAIAAEIRASMQEREGAVPFEVEVFLQRYGAPAG